jgi:hypothetical protein
MGCVSEFPERWNDRMGMWRGERGFTRELAHGIMVVVKSHDRPSVGW